MQFWWATLLQNNGNNIKKGLWKYGYGDSNLYWTELTQDCVTGF
jgi:hypothetical protein